MVLGNVTHASLELGVSKAGKGIFSASTKQN